MKLTNKPYIHAVLRPEVPFNRGAEAGAHAQRAQHTVASQPRVMLVDDNETDNLISSRVLELCGFSRQINIQTSARSALHYLLDNIYKPYLLPEVIFLDINMPVVDGFGFLSELAHFADRMPINCKVIVLSSSDSRQDIERVVGNPHVAGFVTKPLGPSTLNELKKTVF